MKDTVDVDLVKWLIFDKRDISSVSIAKYTGISEQTIGKYRGKHMDLEKASLTNVRALEQYAKVIKLKNKETVEMTSKEILELIKNTNEDVRLVVLLDNERLLKCDFTGNLQDVYAIDSEIYGKFYGVYFEEEDLYNAATQVDSRYNTDEEILVAIENLMERGKIVNIKDVSKEIIDR